MAVVSCALYYCSGAFDGQKSNPITDGHLPYSVVDIPGKGKGLVASRDIQVRPCCLYVLLLTSWFFSARRTCDSRKTLLFSSSQECVQSACIFGDHSKAT